jgi:PAS domain S-box-containing protein
MAPRLLIVDDDSALRNRAMERIRSVVPGIELVEARSEAEFARALDEQEFDAVVADARLGWTTGARVLMSARERWPDTPVVMYQGPDEVGDSVRIALEFSRRRSDRQATENLFRIMFEQSLSGLYVGTLDGRLVDCNPAFARMFGYDSPEELKGKPATDFVPSPELVEEGRIRMMASGGVLTNVESPARRRDGSVFHTMYSARLHQSPDVSLVIATLIDITESHIAREELRHAAQEWRTTFDGISSPIIVLNPDGDVLRINAAGRALAGHDYPSIVGQPLLDFAGREPLHAAAELASRAATSLRPISSTVHDPETRFTWEITAFRSGLPADACGVTTLVLRDITEVIELQESVVRSQTMSRLGQLVAGVAHEVRSPLFGISATLDAFEARFGDEPAFRKYLDNLRRELDRMNELMNDLLELGRPATTHRHAEAVGEIVAEALEACAALASEQGVALQDRLSAPTRARTVLADRRRLLQVFENLLTNAIQHAPTGSEVEVLDGEDTAPGEVSVIVADHGPGFRTEDLPHLFEPFFTRRSGGTGLGLPIVRRILEDHGASVDAYNRTGGGASVRITFPVHEAEATP